MIPASKYDLVVNGGFFVRTITHRRKGSLILECRKKILKENPTAIPGKISPFIIVTLRPKQQFDVLISMPTTNCIGSG